MSSYLKKRKREILDIERGNQAARDFVSKGFDLIEASILGVYGAVTPEMTRRVDLLEALLFSLIEHIKNPTLLNEMVEMSLLEEFEDDEAAH